MTLMERWITETAEEHDGLLYHKACFFAPSISTHILVDIYVHIQRNPEQLV